MSKPLQIARRKSSIKEDLIESMANSNSLNQAELMMKTNIVRRKSLAQNSIPPIISSTTERKELYTKGKPLWFNIDGEASDCYVIGVAGGSASGKTSVSRQIIEGINIPYVVLLSMDNFFKGVVTEEDKAAAGIGDYNFDCPDAIDWELFLETINRLKQGKATKVPHYSFVEHRRIESKCETVYGASVVLIDGIFTLHNTEVLQLLDMKVFVNTDSDVRLARRLMRDLTERGRQLPDVLHQYDKFVKPGYDKYIGPTILNADVVIPRGRENKVAINLIIQHIKRQLEARHIKTSYDELISMTSAHKPSNLFVLPENNQIKAIQTLLRNLETTRDDFIFYAERLMRLSFEYALNFLPHREVEITLEPRDSQDKIQYHGKRFAGQGLCGISILRAGETMEKALMKVTKDIRIGKLLIQNDEFGSPCLHYCRIPQSSRKNFVILMDPTISTGHAAMMAIRVLLDHDFQEENIILVSLLMANCGAQAISYAFPKVSIITATLDPEYDAESGRIIPGFGNFGDRYFGT